MIDSSTLDLVGRLALDVVALLVLVGVLHRRSATAPEMPLVLTSLNLGLLAAVAAIGTGDFPTGVGFGLFGLLSLVRLRSAAFTLKDVAYTFVALVLALVNGLPDRQPALTIALDLVVLVAVWLTDDTRRQPATRTLRVVLDSAVRDEEEARAALASRLSATPLAVAIEEIDTVRETTQLSVLVEAGPGWWALREQREDRRAAGPEAVER